MNGIGGRRTTGERKESHMGIDGGGEEKKERERTLRAGRAPARHLPPRFLLGAPLTR